MQVPTATKVSAYNGATHISEPRRDSHPVPFGGPPAAVPSPLHVRSDLNTKEAASLLGMVGKNDKPTDAIYPLMKKYGFQVNGRGDWRITWEALNRIRGVAA